MVTKRDFGTVYLIGSGLLLIGGLVTYFWATRDSTLVIVVGTLSAGTLAATLPYTGYALRKMDFSDEFIWKIAQWSGLGLGIATLFGIAITFARQYYPPSVLLPGLVVNNIAAGGVVGLLIGAVSELRRKSEREEKLNHRNTVLNRVLRHNIKNDVNVILGHVDLARHRCQGAVTENIDSIERKTREILRLSNAARKIDSITEDQDRKPTSAVKLIEEYTAAASELYPEAELTSDVPDERDVLIDPLFRSILQNIVENAIEHADSLPNVHIEATVDDGETPRITVKVADTGPGIPPDQIESLENDEETALTHGEGLGLYLVKWFVEEKGGRLDFESNPPRGSIVEVSIPAKEPPDE